MGEHDHFVQFCESDEVLVHAVGGFIGSALARGDAGIVVVTPEHRRAIEGALREHGLDVEALAATGRYVALDAREVLDLITVDGLPDAAAFEEVAGSHLSRMESSGWRVRIFGEAVGLLVEAGQRAAAIRLEELWNDLARHRRFSLFCAYRLNGELDGASLGSVCRQHSGVIPGESFASIDSAAERMRAIVDLQQRVTALEGELRKRGEIERAFLQRLRRSRE